MKQTQKILLKGMGRYLIFLFLLPEILTCTKIEDTIRNWGYKQRQSQKKKVAEEQLKNWERDFKLSRARVKQLHKYIQELVSETTLQGHLARKIAHAYCNVGRFEIGSTTAELAAKNLPIAHPLHKELNSLEKSLPYFKEAFRKKYPDPELLFNSGLCFAGASKALGWEKSRFRTALFLFERLSKISPDDHRAYYQMALLYGKTTLSEFRDQERAVRLLRIAIEKSEYDIPNRFALGHFLSEMGKFAEASEEYRRIRNKIKELKEKKMLTGSLKKNRQFIKAGKNIEKLNYCIQDSPQCEIMHP